MHWLDVIAEAIYAFIAWVWHWFLVIDSYIVMPFYAIMGEEPKRMLAKAMYFAIGLSYWAFAWLIILCIVFPFLFELLIKLIDMINNCGRVATRLVRGKRGDEDVNSRDNDE